MYYHYSEKTILRIPFNLQKIPLKTNKISITELDVAINILKIDESILLSWNKVSLSIKPTGKQSTFLSQLRDEESGTIDHLITPFIQTKTDLSFYLSIDQALEIDKFKTAFRSPTLIGQPEAVTLTNNGQDSISIYNAKVCGGDFQTYHAFFPYILHSGDTLEIQYGFTPHEHGAFTSELLIETSMPNHPQISFKLYGVWSKYRSYYLISNKLRYDRLLMETATYLMHNNPKRILDVEHIQMLIRFARDGYRITTPERRTFKYIWNHYRWTEEARKWFNEHYEYFLRQ